MPAAAAVPVSMEAPLTALDNQASEDPSSTPKGTPKQSANDPKKISGTSRTPPALDAGDSRSAALLWMYQLEEQITSSEGEERRKIGQVQSERGEEMHKALDKLLWGTKFAERQLGAHSIATLLAQPLVEAELVEFCRTSLLDHNLTGALLTLAAEADNHGDTVTIQLTLSCITNLSYIGLGSVVAASSPKVASLIVRQLFASENDPAMLAFAMPAVYNLSIQPQVRDELLSSGASPLLVRLAETDDAEIARHARHTLSNIELLDKGDQADDSGRTTRRFSSGAAGDNLTDATSKRRSSFGCLGCTRRADRDVIIVK